MADVRFQYGKTDTYGTDTTWQSGKETGDTFEQAISGLLPNTLYHFRAQARNEAGIVSGDDATFRTLAKWKGDIHIDQLKYQHTERMPQFV